MDEELQSVKHKLTVDLIDSLKSASWEMIVTRPGFAIFTHPGSETEIPTPELIRTGYRAPYPFETYKRLRQLQVSFNAERITSVWTREGVPWVTASEQKVSFKKALEYVNTSWDPAG